MFQASACFALSATIAYKVILAAGSNSLDFTGSQAECVNRFVQAMTVGFIAKERRPIGLSMQIICSAAIHRIRR
jgi:hypothetical protein